MPIDYAIDRDRRLVTATAYGALTDEDIFGYQRSLWSRPDVAGFNELVDMTRVHHIVQPSPDRILELARLAAGMDVPSKSQFAVVAPDDLAFGLARMFASYRRMDERSTKNVSVFRTMNEALTFLGVKTPADPAEA